jgi:ribosome-associated toxin RatA of RatAB toxin-antitoxin module
VVAFCYFISIITKAQNQRTEQMRMSIKRILQGTLAFSLALQVVGMVLPVQAKMSLPKENYLLVNLAEDSHGKAVKTVNARITIDAPPVFVWQTMTNYNKLKEFMPGCKNTELISEDGTNKVLDVASSVSKLLPLYRYRVTVNENRKTYELKVNRISGDFKYLAASYQLYPKGTKTILVYSLNIDPGSGLPDFGINTLLKGNAERTLKAIQNRSELEHKKSLIGQR